MRPTIHILVILAVFVVQQVQAADRYAAHNGQTPDPGAQYLGWATAASNIQDAVNAATTNDTVWVGPGTYTVPPNATNYLGTNVVYINKPLTLRSSNSVPATTLIDGDGLYRGVATYYPVATVNPFVIDGFTISNCVTTNNGGGVLFDDTAPWGGKPCIVRNCIIRDNVSAGAGGGIYAGVGGTSYLSLTASNCVIRGNQSTGASVGGGGICKGDRGIVYLTDCLVASNTAASGGGLKISYSRARIDRCVISGNRATTTANGRGGGALETYVIGTGLPGQSWLRNCLIYNNVAANLGGGVLIRGDPDLPIQNCTIVSNTAAAGGGVVVREQWAGLQSTDCIFYFNKDSDLIVSGGGLWANVHCTNICTSSTNDFSPNIGNITNDPQFADFVAEDFQLTVDSPCLNTGTNLEWMEDTVDLDGVDRILEGTVDRGCYELLLIRGTSIMIH